MAVTSADVVALLGRDLTVAEAARVDRMIELAVGVVEDELPGFAFTPDTETADVVWHDPDVLWTPRYPVTAIADISVGGISLDPLFYRFAADKTGCPGTKGKVELLDAGTPWMVNAPAVFGWPVISVTYAFGLDDTPAGLVNVVAAAVATAIDRQTSNPDGIQSETLLNYSVTYFAVVQGFALALAEDPSVEKTLNRWRRMLAGSVVFTRSR